MRYPATRKALQAATSRMKLTLKVQEYWVPGRNEIQIIIDTAARMAMKI
jgi:hypothetical protein